MYVFWRTVLVSLIYSNIQKEVNAQENKSLFGLNNSHWKLPEIYYENNMLNNIINEINMERAITSLLILDSKNFSIFPRLKDVIYNFPWPKVIVSRKQDSFIFKEYFNMETLAVIIMEKYMNMELLETCAGILDMRRQSRIWTIAVNIKDTEKFKEDLKNMSQQYKMTNMILSFHHDNLHEEYYSLKPYPLYHWLLKKSLLNGNIYYPEYWRNMYGAPLLSFTGQDPPGALVYLDDDVQFKFNGYVARMVLLFAENFNATLEMYKPLKLGEIFSYDDVNLLAYDGLLDIPMTLSADFTFKDVERNSVYYDVIRPFVVLPCPRRLTIREVFALLLNEYFFGCVLIFSISLSCLHSLFDYYLDGRIDPVRLFFSDNILPGILGQSFATRSSPWRGLKFVYLLVSFAGLNIGTLFSANVSTLFSEQPYHKRIESIMDLSQSSHKLLLMKVHAEEMISNFPYIANSIVTTSNGALIINHTRVLNTTYGYAISPPTWTVFSARQQYYSQKIFCRLDDPKFGRLFTHSIALPPQSPHREALNYLILRIHELGFIEAWHSSTFQDMVKLKLIYLHDGNPMVDRRVLEAKDFFIIWLVITIGLSISTLAFVVEYISWKSKKNCYIKH
ncbi:uncharacterized protein LOC142231358 [Haematobia irritans]|uniref:uncharacterized protein LOC142231358 n=1 Tax=Haematobia irritans TaxID=7368 RepID=UPI003F4F992E